MIDKTTVAKILDTADIVEVVSDFVSLRRRGANYIGLCPFHNEKTPSFSVSKAKGICHCFSCGKGGSPVGFIMEHEQLSYSEALRYLAKKYHIEIVEKELTDEERIAQSERESMFLVNEFASKHFEEKLYETEDGRDIGLSYFYERGFSDQVIKKFHLGYSLDNNNALFKEAVAKGYNKKYLFDTGLCIDDSRGGGYDRFKGRVMFPVLNIAGKVIAFSGRTLKADQAKYVNSPESILYKKSNELYGLYQAKQSIVKKDKCFLVEGNADVVSMHQAGFDNTIASLGTALTVNQVRLIHRFTENVTILYDGDSAGIKAALRAINLLLPEGLNIKVLLLPDGEDPDSFSRKHSASEFQEYIDNNEVDFVRFMKQMLLNDAKNDPIKRASVIGDVVTSISLIPFDIPRSIYTKECSELFEIDEKVLLREVRKKINLNQKKEFEKKEKKDIDDIPEIPNSNIDQADYNIPEIEHRKVLENSDKATALNSQILYPHEKDIIKYIVKFGMVDFCKDNNEESTISLLKYISEELSVDEISFSCPIFDKIYNVCQSYVQDYENEKPDFLLKLQRELDKIREEGYRSIQEEILNMQDIEKKEKDLNDSIKLHYKTSLQEYQKYFLEKKLTSHPDDEIRKISLELISEKHSLSKIHTKYGSIKTDLDKLDILVPQAIYNLKDALILCHIKETQRELIEKKDNTDELLKYLQELYDLRRELAKYLGDRVVNPKN